MHWRDALLRLVLLPGACAAAASLVAWPLARGWPRVASAIVAVGLAAGLFAALGAMGVQPSLPLAVSDSAWEWVAWLAPAGALAGVASDAVRLPRVALLALRVVLGAAAAWLILEPFVPHALSVGERFLQVAIAGAAVALEWTAAERGARSGRGASAVAAWLMALAGTAFVLYQFGSAAVMAAAAVALLAGVAVTAAFASRARPMRLPSTTAPVLALALVGLLVAAHVSLNYGSRVLVPTGTVVLLALAPACAAVRRWPLALLLSLVLVAAAAWLAYVRVGAFHPPVY